jgi:hypothetical protein
MTIEQILDELDQRPNALYHIDKYLFPLLDRMLGEHGYQFDMVMLGQMVVSCRIKRQSNLYSKSSAK